MVFWQVLDGGGGLNKFLEQKNDILKQYVTKSHFSWEITENEWAQQEALGEDDGDDDGRIFPEHPSPILHAPRDNISRKDNPSLRYIYIYCRGIIFCTLII